MSRLVPTEGGFLNCQLPNELIRSVVKQVISPNLCIVQLSVSTPMAKTHHYKRDELVPVRRVVGDFGEEVWKAISEYEMEVARREEEDREAAEIRAAGARQAEENAKALAEASNAGD